MIGVYMATKLSIDEYKAVSSKVMGAGLDMTGLLMHSAFGESGSVALYDVWESKEHFENFARHLAPIFESLGLEPTEPDIAEMIEFHIP